MAATLIICGAFVPLAVKWPLHTRRVSRITSNIIQSACLVGNGRLKERCGLEARTNFFSFKKSAKTRCGLDSRIYGISDPHQRTSDLNLTHLTTLTVRKQYKQKRQYSYCVIRNSGRLTIVAVKNDKYYIFRVCIYSLMYPACDVLAPYYFVFHGLPGCTIFFHIISWAARFLENSKNMKCMFCYSLQNFSETFLVIRRTERDVFKNINLSSCKVAVILIRF